MIRSNASRIAKFCRSGSKISRHLSTPHVDKVTRKIPLLVDGTEAVKLWGKDKVKFVDASFHMNKEERDAQSEYLEKHLPQARFIDIDSAEFSDKSSCLPHMMPSQELFSATVSKLGISNSDHIIVYSSPGSFGAARVWWMFKTFGHKKVSILNGGLRAWELAGGTLESGTQVYGASVYMAQFNSSMVATWRDVLDVVNTGAAQLIDARSAARFKCKAPEPRPGLPSGHIPGSLSVPFTSIVQADDVTTFRSKAEISNVFAEAGLIRGSKIIASCGSGVTAAVLVFGLHLIEGFPPALIKIYDGSWTEWGAREDLPKITEMP